MTHSLLVHLALAEEKKALCFFIAQMALTPLNRRPDQHSTEHLLFTLKIAERLAESHRFMEQNPVLTQNIKEAADWNDPRMRALGSLVGGKGYLIIPSARLPLNQNVFLYFTYAALHHWIESLWRLGPGRSWSSLEEQVDALCATAWTLDDKKLWLSYLSGYFRLDRSCHSTGAKLQLTLRRIWDRIEREEISYRHFYVRCELADFQTTTAAEWEQLFHDFLKLLQANKNLKKYEF